MKTDKLNMRNNMEDNIWLNFGLTLYSPQQSRQAVITVSRSTWMTTKITEVAIDLFYTGVIDHPEYMFLN